MKLIITVTLTFVVMTSQSFTLNPFKKAPAKTLENLCEAIEDTDLKEFKNLLTGKALVDFGSDQGLMMLAKKLQDNIKYKQTNQQMVEEYRDLRGVKCIDYQNEETTIPTRQVSQIDLVNSQSNIFMSALIDCDIKWSLMSKDVAEEMIYCYTLYKIECKVSDIAL